MFDDEEIPYPGDESPWRTGEDEVVYADEEGNV